jgi:hypothetical protein
MKADQEKLMKLNGALATKYDVMKIKTDVERETAELVTMQQDLYDKEKTIMVRNQGKKFVEL